MTPEPSIIFTIERANAALPLVRSITRDLAQISREVIERRCQVQRLLAGRSIDDSDPYTAELAQVQEEMESQVGQLDEYLEELAELGVEARNGPEGHINTVDFPAEMDGRLVYLCWQFGEEEVSHWHEIEAGFAGRQKLVAETAAEEAC
jgi:hypothetical protein